MKYLIASLLLIALVTACNKNPLSDIEDGGWNHERTVIDIKLDHQVGVASIERIDARKGKIVAHVNSFAITNWSAIAVRGINVSYQANASVKVGQTLNFDNQERKASLVVTATTGESREYDVYLKNFTETMEGTWSMDNLVVYGGTGPEYGGGAVLALQDKDWYWSSVYPPKAEYDNSLTFVMDNMTADGNTTGTCVNDAGPDGKYADFIFAGSQNKDEPGVDIDLAKFYRQVPKGESRWVRDYATNNITFTDGAGKKTEAKLVSAGEYDLGYDGKITIPNNAFEFSLSGTDDWTYVYSDYDKFVKNPRKYWIEIKKK